MCGFLAVSEGVKIMLLSELGTPVAELKEQISNTWGRL